MLQKKKKNKNRHIHYKSTKMFNIETFRNVVTYIIHTRQRQDQGDKFTHEFVVK